MIRFDMVQGSTEWMDARCGNPTASRFGDILTPKTMRPSASAPKYRNQLLAEWLVGMSLDVGGGDLSGFTGRGRELEDEARSFYEMHFDAEVERVGFVMRNDRRVGGSPDGLVGDRGGVELKVPALHTHIGYLLAPDTLEADYRAQVQGYLYLTDRDWWDVVSYNPALPHVHVRAERDPALIAALDAALDAFVADMDRCRERLMPYRQAKAAA